MYPGWEDGKCLPASGTEGVSMEARMSGRELEGNLDVICYYFILHPGYLRPQEMEFHRQIPMVKSHMPFTFDLLHNHVIWKG